MIPVLIITANCSPHPLGEGIGGEGLKNFAAEYRVKQLPGQYTSPHFSQIIYYTDESPCLSCVTLLQLPNLS